MFLTASGIKSVAGGIIKISWLRGFCHNYSTHNNSVITIVWAEIATLSFFSELGVEATVFGLMSLYYILYLSTAWLPLCPEDRGQHHYRGADDQPRFFLGRSGEQQAASLTARDGSSSWCSSHTESLITSFERLQSTIV